MNTPTNDIEKFQIKKENEKKLLYNRIVNGLMREINYITYLDMYELKYFGGPLFPYYLKHKTKLEKDLQKFCDMNGCEWWYCQKYKYKKLNKLNNLLNGPYMTIKVQLNIEKMPIDSKIYNKINDYRLQSKKILFDKITNILANKDLCKIKLFPNIRIVDYIFFYTQNRRFLEEDLREYCKYNNCTYNIFDKIVITIIYHGNK